MQTLRILRFLLEKEFKQIRRDRFLGKIIFMLPVMQLLILPFAANFEMRNINLSLVDGDRSAFSRELADQILSSGYFRLVDFSDTYSQALLAVERNEADIIVEIPAGFEKRLFREGGAELYIAADAVNGTKGGLGSSYLTSILQRVNLEKGWRVTPQGKSRIAAKRAYRARSVETIALFNPHLDYKSYMVPGIIVFLLTIIGGFVPALNIVSEKEKGTIEQINVSPVPKSVFLLSKLIPFWIIGFILLTLALLIARLVYGLTPAGGIGIIYLFAAVYLVGFTGLGLAVSSISSTQQQAMFTAFFFIIIFALLSGLFTPISSMPAWAQTLTAFNPLRYFVEVMRRVYLAGSGLSDLWRSLGVICLFALLFNVLAVWSYRKKE